jgi:hypothetical protein
LRIGTWFACCKCRRAERDRASRDGSDPQDGNQLLGGCPDHRPTAVGVLGKERAHYVGIELLARLFAENAQRVLVR